MDINHGFILATTITPASVNDTNYLPYCTAYSRHTKQSIEMAFADKGYLPSGISLREPAKGWIPPGKGKPNREFLALNNIADGIMRKDSTTAKFTQ